MATEVTIELDFRNQRFRNASRGLLTIGRRLETSLDKINPIARKELTDMLDSVAEALKQRHSTPWNYEAMPLPSGDRTGRLAVRSGSMLADIASSVKVTGSTLDNLTGTINGPSIHEFGGVIRPRRTQYLAVPLKAALDTRGLPIRVGPRAWPNTFVIKSRAGNLLIVRKKPGGSLEPLYILKRSVRIPPRLGLATTLQAAVDPFQDRLFDAIIRSLSLQGVNL